MVLAFSTARHSVGYGIASQTQPAMRLTTRSSTAAHTPTAAAFESLFSRNRFAHQKWAFLSTKRPIALSPPNQGKDNDGGRIRKASDCESRALYGMPSVRRALNLGRTPA